MRARARRVRVLRRRILALAVSLLIAAWSAVYALGSADADRRARQDQRDDAEGTARDPEEVGPGGGGEHLRIGSSSPG